MSANVNKVFIIGNMTRDPELNYTPQGTAVCKFSLAVNRQYKGSDGEMKKQTDFFSVVVWGKAGENCKKYLEKGRPVFVEGRLQNRSYEASDGSKRTVTEIISENVQFLGSGGGHRKREDAEEAGQNTGRQTSEMDDVPF